MRISDGITKILEAQKEAKENKYSESTTANINPSVSQANIGKKGKVRNLAHRGTGTKSTESLVVKSNDLLSTINE